MHVNENGTVVIHTLLSPTGVQNNLSFGIAIEKSAFTH